MHYQYKRAAPVHFHPDGHHCHCPFGDPRKEQYLSPRQQEFVGSKQSFWKEASKYDWLMDRPDVKDDPSLQRFIKKANAISQPSTGEEGGHDALLPWLLREHKKGRLHDIYPDDENAMGFQFTNHHGRVGYLQPDHLDQIMDWMKYQKQKGEGVDIMKHEIGPAIEHAQKNDLGGEIVHTFDDENTQDLPSYSPDFNGWNVVRLRNARDLRTEGSRMNHCVGSNGMGYIEKNEDGKGAYYSLRTPDNNPVATLEMEPKSEEYFKCPNCGKFGYSQMGYQTDPETGRTGYMDKCEHCGHVLRTMDPDTRVWSDMGDVEKYPTKINHKKPSADHMKASQLFGHSDKKLDDAHEALVNTWLSGLGHDWMDSDGEPDYEEEEEPEFEPWWDDEYSVPGARDVDEFLNHHVAGEYHDSAPHEYDRAMADAHEHDMEGPDLYLEEPDVEDIFDDMASRHGSDTGSLDPEEIASVFKGMKDTGYEDQFHHHAQQWLDSEYNPYLDPYGQYQGKGWFPAQMDSITGPRTETDVRVTPNERGQWTVWINDQAMSSLPDREQAEKRAEEYRHTPGYGLKEADPAVSEPGSHYPAMYPAEGLFAKNLMYHLGRQENPQGQGTWAWPSYEGQQYPDDPYKGPTDFWPYRDRGGEPAPMAEQQQSQMFPDHWYTNRRGWRRETNLPPELFPPEREHSAAPQVNEDQGELWQSYNDQSVIRTQTPFAQPSRRLDQEHPEWQQYWQGQEPGALPRADWIARTAAPPPQTPSPGAWTDFEQQNGAWPEPTQGVQHMNGRVAESNVSHYMQVPGMEWRRPVAYHRGEDKLYVGQPSMEHGEMMKHFGMDSPWIDQYTANPQMIPGYIDETGQTQPGLHFYMTHPVPQEHQFHDWVESRFGVRAPQTTDDLTDEDFWSSSYHSGEEDSWAADDEADFSTTVPEPRWQI